MCPILHIVTIAFVHDVLYPTFIIDLAILGEKPL